MLQKKTISYNLLIRTSSSTVNNVEDESGDEGEKDTAKHKDSFVASPDAPRLEKVRHSLKKLEEKRNGYLYEKHVIGRVSNRRRDIVKELASISSRKVPFKWQRGNKIGKSLEFGIVLFANAFCWETLADYKEREQGRRSGENVRLPPV